MDSYDKIKDLKRVQGSEYRTPYCNKCFINDVKMYKGKKYIDTLSGKCFKANNNDTTKYQLNSAINGTNVDIFDSCINGIDTRYDGLAARFIRIRRHNSKLPVIAASIEIFNIIGEKLKPITARAEPPMIGHSGKNLIDGSVHTYASTTNEDGAYLEVDLGKDIRLFIITVLPHILHRSEMQNTELVIFNNNMEVKFTKVISFGYDLILVEVKEGVYRDDEKIELDANLWPNCIDTGCLNKDGETIPGYKYVMANEPKNDYEDSLPVNNKCFRANKKCKKCIPTSDTDYVHNGIFGSCSDNVDTTVSTYMGMYIRLESATGITIYNLSGYNNSIINKVSNYSNNGKNRYERHKYVEPVYSNANPTESLTNSLTHTDKFNKITIESSGYIQIAYAKDTPITDIQIGLETNNDSINNAILYFITEDNLVVMRYDIQFNELADKKVTNIINGIKPPKGVDIYNFNIEKLIDRSVIKNSVKKYISDEYVYPGCLNNCFSNGKQIVEQKYKLSDGRCFKAKTDCSDCLYLLDNARGTSKGNIVDLNKHFVSCSNDIDSRVIPVKGRYLRMKSVGKNIGFHLREIMALNGTNNYGIVASNGFPLDKSNGTVMKTEYCTDGDVNTYGGVKGEVGTLIVPFMQFDLGSDKFISEVVIDPKFPIDDVMLFLISASNIVIWAKKINITSRTTFNISSPSEYEKSKYADFIDISNIYNFPECVSNGCYPDNKFILNEKYNNTEDGTCRKALSNDSSCLSKTLDLDTMNRCYGTCSDVDLRWPPSNGRFVRLYPPLSGVLNINTLSVTFTNGSSKQPYIPISTYVYDPLKSNKRGIDLSGGIELSDPNSFIEVDIGSNKRIDFIILDGIDYIDSRIKILKEDGTVVTEKIVEDSEIPVRVSPGIRNIATDLYTRYEYPECLKNTDCVTSDGFYRPNVKYDLENKSCVLGNIDNNCKQYGVNCLLKWNTNDMDISDVERYFTSCDPPSKPNTIYPPSSIKYIKITPKDGKSGFSINNIKFKHGNNLVEKEFYAAHPIKSGSSGSNMFVDSSSDTIVDKSTNSEPFVLIEFSSVGTNLSSIELSGELNNTNLYILSNDRKVILKKDLGTVTDGIIPIIPDSTVYTDINMVNEFNYPSCVPKGCITNNRHIDIQKYKTSDGLCFSAKGNEPIVNCLNNLSNLEGTSMDRCFDSCETTKETRYKGSEGKFMRFINKNSNSVSIKSIRVYNSFNVELVIYSIYGVGILNSNTGTDKLNSIISTDSVVLANNSYIDIMYDGSDLEFKKVMVSTPSSIAIETLVPFKLELYDDSRRKIYESDVDTITNKVSSQTLTLEPIGNISNGGIVPIDEVFNYPSCDTDGTNFECTTTDDKAKPYFKYNIPDSGTTFERCFKTKDKLSDINMKLISDNDPSLDKSTIESNFDSCDTNTETRFPYIQGRYIIFTNTSTINIKKFIPKIGTTDIPIPLIYAGPMMNKSSIRDILDNTNNNAISISSAKDGYTNLSINPYIQLDLESDKKISSITLTAPQTGSSLSGSLYVINDLNDVVYRNENINTYGTIQLLNLYETIPQDPVIKSKHTMGYKIAPDCTTNGSCYAYDDNSNFQLIKGMNYKTIDRCVKPKEFLDPTTTIDKIYDTADPLSNADIRKFFDSCKDDVETRFSKLNARFIRVVGNNLSLVSISSTGDSGSTNTIIFTHNKPLTNWNLRSDHLLKTANSSPVVSTTSGYIQVDYGSEISINDIIVTSSSIPSEIFEVLAVSSVGAVLGKYPYTNFKDSNIFNIIGASNNGSGERVTIIEEFMYYPDNSSVETMTTPMGGLTEDGFPKPMFKYTLPSGLSAIATSFTKNVNFDLQKVANNEFTTAIMDTVFSSSKTDYDTRFPHVQCRYIMILNDSGNGFDVPTIDFINIDTSIVVKTPNLLKWPSTDGTNILPSNTVVTIPGASTSIVLSNLINNDTRTFILYDFVDITTIDFIEFSTNPSSELSNCKLLAILDNGDIIYNEVLNTTVTKYEMLNIGGNSYGNIDLNFRFVYETCVNYGCIPNNNQFDRFEYTLTTDPELCFSAVNSKTVGECLGLLPKQILSVNELDGTPRMDTCFISCDSNNDTRYGSTSGRYIRITGDTGRTDNIMIKNIQIFKDPTGLPYNPNTESFTAHANLMSMDGTIKLHGEYVLLDNDNYASCEFNGTNRGYIQIDMGSTKEVNRVKLSVPSNLDMTHLVNTKIQLISDSGTLVSELILNASNLSTANSIIFNILKNKPNTEEMTFKNDYNWPTCLTNTDCVSSTGRSKPNFTYTFDDATNGFTTNRSARSKDTQCDIDNCVQMLYEFNLSDNSIIQNFDSILDNTYSQFTNVVGRYIRIRKLDDKLSGISIKSINVLGPDGTSIIDSNTVAYGKRLTDTSYASYMIDGDTTTSAALIDYTGTSNMNLFENNDLDDSYLQLDLGEDKTISYVDIVPESYQTFRELEIIVITSDNFIVFKKEIITNPTESDLFLQ